MTNANYPFHIQQNTDLHVVAQTIALGRTGEISPYELAVCTGKTETDILKRIRAPLGQMEVLNRWELAPFGRRLAKLQEERPELLGEAMHVQLYTMHWRNPVIYFSFAYAAVCDWLYERGEFLLDGDGQAALVGMVLNRASETYPMLNSGNIAFSKSSVQGAAKWLAATEPPALVENEFRRRHAVPMHSLLWSIDALYTSRRIARGTRLSLDEDTEMTLCHSCLLDSEALSRALDIVCNAYDYRRGQGFFGMGAEGGFGRWLLLNKCIPIGALEPSNEAERFPELDDEYDSESQSNESDDLTDEEQ